MITKIQSGSKLASQNVQRKNIAQLNFNGKEITPKRILTDEVALHLLKKELIGDMPEKEANDWVSKIKQICQKHNIKIKSLPINEEHKGSLSPEENSNLFTEVFYSVFSDSNAGKIELKTK